jgi:hypothetical protein
LWGKLRFYEVYTDGDLPAVLVVPVAGGLDDDAGGCAGFLSRPVVIKPTINSTINGKPNSKNRKDSMALLFV